MENARTEVKGTPSVKSSNWLIAGRWTPLSYITTVERYDLEHVIPTIQYVADCRG